MIQSVEAFKEGLNGVVLCKMCKLQRVHHSSTTALHDNPIHFVWQNKKTQQTIFSVMLYTSAKLDILYYFANLFYFHSL